MIAILTDLDKTKEQLIGELRTLRQSLAEREQYDLLFRLHDYLLQTRNITEGTDRVLNETMTFLQAEYGGIYLAQDDQMRLLNWRNISETWQGCRGPVLLQSNLENRSVRVSLT